MLAQVVVGVPVVPMGHDFFNNKSGRIYVKTMAGKVMEISVKPGDLIETIKKKIQEQTGLSPNDQNILHAGQKLRDDRSLSDYNIKNNATLHLLLGDEDPMQIMLQSHFDFQNGEYEMNIFYQEHTLQLKIQAAKTVKDLKALVAKTIVRPVKEIVLLFGGKLLLDEERSLFKAGIVNHSNIVVIPTADGGDCLRFTQLVLETVVKDLQHLKSSFDFLQVKERLENFVEMAEKKIKNIKERDPKLANVPEEALISIMLWTSDILYRQLNEVLKGGEDFSQWNVYLKNLLNGLKAMPYHRGKVYRGYSQKQDLNIYRKKGLINWRTVSALSRNKEVAESFAGESGMIFEVEVVSGRKISSLSISPLEEEVIMLPHSCFEVLEVIEETGKPVYIKLREVPTPRAPKVVFWTDDNPEHNHKIAKQIEEKDNSCVFCVSTKDALRVVEKYRWLLYFENSDFRIITDMVRHEDGVPNYNAGIDLVERLLRDFNYNFEILIFCKDVESAKKNCDERKLKGRFTITKDSSKVHQFLNFN